MKLAPDKQLVDKKNRNTNGHGSGNSSSANGHNGRLRLMDLNHVSPEKGVGVLIDRALELRADDLYIVTNEQHVSVQVRLRGQVEQISVLDAEQGRRYIAHIRNVASMDVSDHRRPHDGRWIYEVDDQRTVDLRINIIPTLHGDDLAIRLLDRQTDLMSLDRLGMTARQLDTYRPMLEQPGGMILFTGPTGSGKTVTLYASLTHLNNGKRKIHTIEDPIEYAIEGLRQSQVNQAIDLGPTEILRGVLRQSPDVAMVGEIRDDAIAHTAAWAANSGVMVLSTIHAGNAAGAVQSLRGFNIPTHAIATSLRAAISQRLVRTLCPACQEHEEAGHTTEVKRIMEEIKAFLPSASLAVRFTARGCDHCHGTGYAGCTAIYEIMPVTDALRELILEGCPARDIHARAMQEGMLTLRQSALLKVAQGRTTMEEVRRVVPDMPMEPTLAA
ncbi:MAG: ral secretion pathway protein [Humisphaera sp.]|nr:ral secretion pathway protein [Humisphaera sp.]